MERPTVPALPLFAVLSLLVHAAALAALARSAPGILPVGFEKTPPTLAGDTLDIDPTATLPAEDPSPLSPPSASTSFSTSIGAPRATLTPLPRASGSARAISTALPTFGAVGVRFATDLVTTFTRSFPQAASADPIWSSVPYGSAGRAYVTLELDEEGRLIQSEIVGSPSPALRTSIERTLVLLASRAFTASGATTRLIVTAYVSRDDVHDGLHGDVFALSGGSFSGDVGTAFFALPPSSGPGRRVDVELRLVQ